MCDAPKRLNVVPLLGNGTDTIAQRHNELACDMVDFT